MAEYKTIFVLNEEEREEIRRLSVAITEMFCLLNNMVSNEIIKPQQDRLIQKIKEEIKAIREESGVNLILELNTYDEPYLALIGTIADAPQNSPGEFLHVKAGFLYELTGDF